MHIYIYVHIVVDSGRESDTCLYDGSGPTYAHTHTHSHAHVSIYLFIYLFICVFIDLLIYLSINIYLHTHTYAYRHLGGSSQIQCVLSNNCDGLCFKILVGSGIDGRPLP